VKIQVRLNKQKYCSSKLHGEDVDPDAHSIKPTVASVILYDFNQNVLCRALRRFSRVNVSGGL
jgi:hypothetical protein